MTVTAPLFTYGLAFLLGVAFHPIPAIALALFCARSRLFLALLVGVAGFAWHQTGHLHPEEGSLEGQGILSVSSISIKTLHGKPSYFFRATLLEFKSEGKLYKNIPITFSLKEKGPPHDSQWLVFGKLIKRPHGWVYKADLERPWVKIAGSRNLAETRFHLKQKVKTWIENSMPHPQAASLLTALATGDFDDKSMSGDFNRSGLSHLLAISGFHFALLAAFLGAIIKPFASPKKASFLMLLLLGAYFLFLGDSPSVLRAFLTLFVFLLCPFFQESSRGENSLGLSLIICLLLEPFWAFSIGFQLSFLSTAAILIIFPLLDAYMKKWMVPREAQIVSTLGLLQRLGLIVLSFLRQSLALNFAIMLVGVPALLILFHQFPLLSLFYNLFFPFLISLSLFMLLLSIAIPWIHIINSYYTDYILNLTHELPISCDITLQTHACTVEVALLSISAIFYFALHKKETLNYS